MGKHHRSVFIDVNRTYQHKIDGLKLLEQKNNRQFRQQKVCKNSSFKNFNLPEKDILPVRILKRSNILLPYKLFLKKQDSIRFKKCTEISIFDKYNINHPCMEKYLPIGQSSDICTITELDESFYKYVNGRPKNLNEPVFKTLKLMLNDYIRIRQEIGYKKDCILNIEINKRNENHVYDLSARRITSQANYFDKYISEDYRHSMSLLEKWERLEHNVEVKVKELQNLANEVFTTKSRIVSLDYKYSQQQKYGRFLYYLSPPTWRLHNREFARSVEIEARGFDFDESRDEDTFNVIFEKLRSVCFGQPIKPVLYFTYPDEIIKVFNKMENQELHYFTHVTHLTPIIKNLKDSLESLKGIITLDSASILNSIKIFEYYLNFYENRCEHLKEKFYKILFGMFYDSVGTLDVLKLQLHLEFCFEKIMLDKPINMDIVSIAKQLELFYMDYSYRLDNIRGDKVRQAVSKCQEIEKQKIIKAKQATKELRRFNRLEKQLLRVHGLENSNIAKTHAKVHNNRPRNNETHPYVLPDTTKCGSLTANEVEYLALFTDWTENEDPAKYLQRLSK